MQHINECVAWVKFRFHSLQESHYSTCLFFLVSHQEYEEQEINRLNNIHFPLPTFPKDCWDKKALRNFKGKNHISHLIMHVCWAVVEEEEMSVMLLFVLFFPLRKNKENLESSWGRKNIFFCEILCLSTERILNIKNYIGATLQFFRCVLKLIRI